MNFGERKPREREREREREGGRERERERERERLKCCLGIACKHNLTETLFVFTKFGSMSRPWSI